VYRYTSTPHEEKVLKTDNGKITFFDLVIYAFEPNPPENNYLLFQASHFKKNFKLLDPIKNLDIG
jgi:hypothetical protein